jgi:hypothetical protein
MTQIVTIFASLAAMQPAWSGGATPKVWNGAVQGDGGIRATLTTASIPLRILSTTGDLEGRDFAFIALGKLSNVTWVIEDLLLAKVVSEGDSLKGISPSLVGYADSYITKLRDLRAPSTNSHVVGASFKPGVYEWGGFQCFGLKALVSIQEFQSAA